MNPFLRGLPLLLLPSIFLLPLRAATSDWPQWHGPNRDGLAPTGAPVPTALPKELKPLWKIPVGGGFAAPVVAGGKLVYLDENGEQEIAHLLDAATGREIWKAPFSERSADEWGAGPRATPIMDGNRVYVQSTSGEFRCLNLADGKLIWGVSFEKDFGVKFLGYKANSGTATRRGNNGSGVVDGNAVIVPVGSTEGASLVCFDKLTGKQLWKVGEDEAAYSSLMVATLAGVKHVIAFTATALLGVDRQTGKLLWRVPLKSGANRHACTPVIAGDTITVASQTLGLVCTRIAKAAGGGVEATSAWVNKDLKINLATPALAGHYFYCQGATKDFVCVEAKTGEVKWSQPGFGNGKRDYASTIVVGKNLLVLTEDGQLLLLATNPEKYTELGRLQVCGGTWSFPAYANGHLFVRDGRELSCLSLLPPKLVPVN